MFTCTLLLLIVQTITHIKNSQPSQYVLTVLCACTPVKSPQLSFILRIARFTTMAHTHLTKFVMYLLVLSLVSTSAETVWIVVGCPQSKGPWARSSKQQKLPKQRQRQKLKRRPQWRQRLRCSNSQSTCWSGAGVYCGGLQVPVVHAWPFNQLSRRLTTPLHSNMPAVPEPSRCGSPSLRLGGCLIVQTL